MARAYYSAVLAQPVQDVWGLVRDFNNYPKYIDGVDASVIEDEKPGDAVGAIRRFRYGGHWIRQRLISLSDAERSFSYAGLDPFPYPASSDGPVPAPIAYEGTLRLTPIAEGNRTFVEWWVDFTCAGDDLARWHAFLNDAIASWVESLAAHVEQNGKLAHSYFSKAFRLPADAVWQAVRDFGEYRWGEGVGEARIEGATHANDPGAIRTFEYYGQKSQQRLKEHSDAERSMTWESVVPFDETLNYYRATLRVSPIVESDGAFVEWSVAFDAREDAVDTWREHQVREFGKSLNRLERLLGEKAEPPHGAAASRTSQ